MVKCSDPNLDDLFSALGEPSRRSVVRALATGEKSLSEISAPLDMTMAAVMKHVAMLERAGLVTTEKRGRTRYCKLQPARLRIAQEWIDETTSFWTARLKSMARHLEQRP